MSSVEAKPKPSGGLSNSLIPLSVIDAPTQRVYLASTFILIETYKVYHIIASFYLESSTWTSLGTFLLIDFVFLTAASRLRVPRLDFSRAKWTIIFTLLGALDWIACGGWRSVVGLVQWIPILGWISRMVMDMWSSEFLRKNGEIGDLCITSNHIFPDAFNREMSFSEHRVRLKDIIEPKHHIFGQHTIHILPYSTAALAPTTSTSSLSSCFCLDVNNAKAEVTIPIVFNNTDPQYLSYSITPFDSSEEPQIFNITIPKGSLMTVGGNSESRELIKKREDDLDLELEDSDDQRRVEGGIHSGAVVKKESREVVGARNNGRTNHAVHTPTHRSSSQSAGLLYHLPIKQVGRVKLERVLDRNRYDARLSRGEVMVVECPTMRFSSKERQLQIPSKRNKENHLLNICPGEEATLDVQVRGLAPLEFSYSRRLSMEGKNQQHSTGTRKGSETFTISHVSGNSSTPNPLSSEEDREARLAVILNSKAQSDGGPSFNWARARDVNLPVTMELSTPGKYIYELEQVKDACGNTFRMNDATDASQRIVEVHPRRIASFVGCNAQNPINLLQGGQTKDVQIQIDAGKKEEGPFEVQVRYQGAEEDWQRNVIVTDRTASFAIDKPGTYTLEEVKGQYCTGEVGSPWMCSAREIPPPTSIIEVDPIQDQCAGPVGVKALAILSGTPPFKIKYTIQSKGGVLSRHEKTIDRTRDEIEFRPSSEGQVTYTFTGLSDANYKDIKLDGPTFTQNLHPIAKASFVGSQQGRGPSTVLHSCEGNSSHADVRLEGVGPFELSYAVRTRGGELAYTKQIKDITEHQYKLKVEVPSQVAERGGLLTVTLTSIKDAKGCERPLTTSDLSIEVRRSKPTITFMEPRDTWLLEGSEAKLPVRLSGEGPWNVVYRREGPGEPLIHTKIHHSESTLVVAKSGNYLLEEISDQHCPGSVVIAKGSHLVSMRPRPKAAFTMDAQSEVIKDGTISRRPVCVGEPDLASVQLEGHFPIEISYQHRLPSKEVVKETFTSAQETTTIQLFTSVSGHHTYELTSVGDTVYSSHPLSNTKANKKIVTQDVYPLPDLVFASSSSQQGGSSKSSSGGVAAKTKSLCVGDSLTRQRSSGSASSGSENILMLTGKTPFSIDVEIRDGLGTTRKVLSRSGIDTHRYSLDIEADEFVFDKTGKWSVEVTRVVDGNGCERALGKSSMIRLGEETSTRETMVKGLNKMEIEVVETANISAVEERKNHCVGETIEYVLQGTPPWTIAYNFEGTVSHAPIRTPNFSRIAEKAGKLQIESIAHQQNKCQNVVKEQSGMTKIIHPLPTVYVKEGKHYIEDLREGTQAEIVFKLQGSPPFSFSIQRSQAIDRFHRPTILESYTVRDIKESSYSLFTSEEGTWSVTWLRDRFCEVSLDDAALAS